MNGIKATFKPVVRNPSTFRTLNMETSFMDADDFEYIMELTKLRQQLLIAKKFIQ